MANPRLIVKKDFKGYRRELDAGIETALRRTAVAVRNALHTGAPVGDGTSGVQPGHHRDTYRVYPVRRGRHGLEIDVVSHDPTAIWLRWGTLGRRRKKLSPKTAARRSTASGQERFARVGHGRGVKPNPFFSRAARVGRDRLVEELRRSLPR